MHPTRLVYSVFKSRFRRMPGPLVWIDCEMTGLNPDHDQIIELSCFVTDAKLQFLEPRGFTRVIHCEDSLLDQMDDWCKNTHGKSGLWAKTRVSSHTAASVQAELLAYLQGFMKPREGVLAGNSVHMDRMFLYKQFPKITEFLHYRIVDVSSIKEVGMRHNPELMAKVPPKQLNHTAKADILESIAELRWYYENYLRSE